MRLGGEGVKNLVVNSVATIVPDIHGPTKAEFLQGLYGDSGGFDGRRVERLVWDLAEACRRGLDK